MKVLENHSSESIRKETESNVNSTSLVTSDKASTCNLLEELVETHVTEYSSKQTTNEVLKWVHIVITNAKNMCKGVFHKMNREFLQNYLNEFCYKLNRRYFRLRVFQRLTYAIASSLYKQNYLAYY